MISTHSPDPVREPKAYQDFLVSLVGKDDPAEVQAATPGRIRELLSRAGGRADTRPADGEWSVLECIAHIGDAELVASGRYRWILAHDEPALIGYDQDLWAERLRYAASDVAGSLQTWSALRRADLRLLDGASEADFARVGVHAERGEETVAHMVRMFAGHDLMHLRQLERIRRAVTLEA